MIKSKGLYQYTDFELREELERRGRDANEVVSVRIFRESISQTYEITMDNVGIRNQVEFVLDRLKNGFEYELKTGPKWHD